MAQNTLLRRIYTTGITWSEVEGCGGGNPESSEIEFWHSLALEGKEVAVVSSSLNRGRKMKKKLLAVYFWLDVKNHEWRWNW